MKSFNGNRLKLARQYRGLTVEELSQKINVSKQTISQYETGKIENVPFDRIASLASTLNFPYQYFIQDANLELKTGTTYFRSLMKTNKKYRVAQSVKMQHLAKIYSFLNEYVSFPVLNLPNWIGTITSPTEAAYALREYWNLGDKPIDNIMRVVEENGIIVTTFPTDTDDIDAFSQYIEMQDGDVYLIALSKNKEAAVRMNFDIAHELGHIMLHEWSEDEELISREEFKFKEKEANEFAAAFLMPETSFVKDVALDPQNLNYYLQLKRKWKVSIAAMLYRTCELKIVTQNQYQYMIRIMQSKDWRKNEPLDNILVSPVPSLFIDAVDVLLTNNVFTPKEFVAELSELGLAMNPDELETLLNLNNNTLNDQASEPAKIVILKTIKGRYDYDTNE
ncbi:MAG: ImmA/IrrE family metallo-endopeptidase [Clostridia bacterium]|nr:ImmA/IrrE family metallo-endopeptidase [Clostridia bacterium]